MTVEQIFNQVIEYIYLFLNNNALLGIIFTGVITYIITAKQKDMEYRASYKLQTANDKKVTSVSLISCWMEIRNRVFAFYEHRQLVLNCFPSIHNEDALMEIIRHPSHFFEDSESQNIHMQITNQEKLLIKELDKIYSKSLESVGHYLLFCNNENLGQAVHHFNYKLSSPDPYWTKLKINEAYTYLDQLESEGIELINKMRNDVEAYLKK